MLVSSRVEFSKTHRTVRLLDLAQQHGAAVPPEVREAGVLTVYATHTRYPSAGEDVEESEPREAIKLAERVVQWAEKTVRGGRA